MNTFLTLWHREVTSWFRTFIAYVVGVFFLIVTGFSLWMTAIRMTQGNATGDMPGSLFASPWFWLAMLIAVPLLTMRLFAEERRLGTLEMLLTAPVTETEVVLAKFAGAWFVFLLLWSPTLAYSFLLQACGAVLPPLDGGALATGFFGTMLVGAFFLAMGLLFSLLTRHQAIAAMGSLGGLGVLLSAGALPASFHSEHLRQIVRTISAPMHMRDFAAGIVDTSTVIWYVSATALLLFISIRMLEARRLR